MSEPPSDPVEATKAASRPTSCVCEDGNARFSEFETRDVGCDETEGRFADVTLNRCRTCGRLWLRYLVEYEAFSRSGRWARGLIDEATAAAITPQAAVAHLDSLDRYLYGGSYFDGVSGWRSGPMQWGL